MSYTRTAERWNLKQAEANPLFAQAGLLHQVADLKAPTDYEESRRLYHQRREETRVRLLRHAKLYRIRINRRRGTAHLIKCIRRWHRSLCPKTHEYEADFFYQRWRECWTDDERERYEPWRAFDRELARRYSPTATQDQLSLE